MNKTNLCVWYSSNITFYATSQSFIIFRVETHNDVGLFLQYTNIFMCTCFLLKFCVDSFYFYVLYDLANSNMSINTLSLESSLYVVQLSLLLISYIHTFYYAYLTMFDNVIPSCDMLCLSIYIGYKKLGYIH